MSLSRKVLARLYASAIRERERCILGLLEEDKAANLLDLGSGDGRFTLQLAKKIGTPNICCIDIAETFVAKCEAKGMRAIQSDLNEVLPLANESFDAVHANQIWEHLHHTDLFMREMFRVTRLGGYVVISVPNLAVWHNMIPLLLGWQLFTTAISDEICLGNPLNLSYKLKGTEVSGSEGVSFPLHRRVLCYRGLKELIQYHGFKVEKMAGSSYFPFPLRIGRMFSRLDARHATHLVAKARKVLR